MTIYRQLNDTLNEMSSLVNQAQLGKNIDEGSKNREIVNAEFKCGNRIARILDIKFSVSIPIVEANAVSEQSLSDERS